MVKVAEAGRISPALQGRKRIGRVMLAPAVLTIIVIAGYPLAFILLSSFSSSSLGKPFSDWVGLQHFADLLGDGTTIPSLGRSLLLAFPSTLLAIVAGYVVALALDVAVRSGRVIRVVLLLPLMTPPVMAGVIWKLFFAPTGGFVNNVLQFVFPGMEPVLFLGSSPAAIASLIIADAWQWAPFCVLLIFAALRTLPTEVYEAAQVDGAGVWQTFWRITFPLSLPSAITVFLLKLIVSFKVFDLVFIMTNGGPGFDTTVSSFEIYRTALQKFDVGAAAAQTIVFLVLVTIVIVPLNALRHHANREE